jgi:excisionase family DNA binding protein
VAKPKKGEEEPRSAVEPRFLTLEDVATYLSVSTPQAYALVRSGELPAVKLGGRGVWRVDRQQLEDYVERLHTETAVWTKAHPLTAKDKARAQEE